MKYGSLFSGVGGLDRAVEEHFGAIATGPPNRTARLRALGNAVVTAQALRALKLAAQGPRQAMMFG